MVLSMLQRVANGFGDLGSREPRQPCERVSILCDLPRFCTLLLSQVSAPFLHQYDSNQRVLLRVSAYIHNRVLHRVRCWLKPERPEAYQL